MKLLFDQNLSRMLVQLLADAYPGSIHVQWLGFERTPDIEIWRYAAEHDFVLVSKDKDFAQLASLPGAPPVVIVVPGNAPTRLVESALRRAVPAINELVEDKNLLLILAADED